MAEDERWNRDTVPASPSAPSRPPRKPVVTSPFDPPPSERFEEGDELGRGGMGRVFEARDVVLDRAVAIKQSLTDDAQMLVRFEREALITAQLQHPGIVPVLDAGRDANGRPYYVMRKIEGRPLATVVKEMADARARLALLPNMLAAVDAVAYAHARGVIHRDLKPWNILLGPFGETFVIDWGLARDLATADATGGITISGDDGLTRVGSALGTPGFMAPEQARGDTIDRRADVYALGATLVHLLAGTQPFADIDPTVAIEAVARDEVPTIEFPEVVPTELRAIALKAMAGFREGRYADAGELASDLRRFLGGQLVAAHEYTMRERVVRWLRRHRIAVAVASIATIALVVISTIAIRNVVVARDDAREARQRADDRADQLLVDRAEAIAMTDATYAIALLKQLAPESRMWSRARVVATTAVASGVGWGLPLVRGGAYGRLYAAPGGDTVALVVDGTITLIDPSLQKPPRVLVEHPDGFNTVAWFDDQTLIYVELGSATIVSISRDGKTRRLDSGGGESAWLVMAPGESRIFAMVDKNLRELDPKGGPPLTDYGPHKMVDRAPGLLLYGEDEAQLTFHEDDKPPVNVPGISLARYMLAVHPSHDRMATFDNGEVVEHERINGVWAERGRWAMQVQYVVYRGLQLMAVESSGIAILWPNLPPHREVAPISRERSIIANGAFATEHGVFVAGDNGIYLMHGGRPAMIATYSDPPISFVKAGPYLVVLARTGTLRSFDLRQFLPEEVPSSPGMRADALDANHAWFVRNEQLMVYDRATRKMAGLPGLDHDESSLACAGPEFSIVRLDERRRSMTNQPARAVVYTNDGKLTPIEGTYRAALCTSTQRWLGLQGRSSVEVRDPRAPNAPGRVFTTNQPIRSSAINETWLGILDETNTLTHIELATGRSNSYQVGEIERYTIDTRGRIVTLKDDALTLWGPAGPKLIADKLSVAIIFGHPVGFLVFTREKTLIVIDETEQVRRYDIGEIALSVAWDVPRLAIILDGKPAVLDLRDGSTVRYPWPARTVAISRDGSAIAWASSTGQADILRIDVPEQPHEVLRWLDRLTNATLEPGSTEITWKR